MIQVEVEQRRSKTSSLGGSLGPNLVLNGELIEDSWAKQENEGVHAYVYNMPAVTLLLECRLAEIADHFSFLCLRLPEYPGNNLSSYMNIRRHEQDGIETLQFEFSPSIDLEHWAKPWSFADFSSIVTKIIEDRHIPGFSYSRGFGYRLWGSHPNDLLPSNWAFSIELHALEETVQQAVQSCLPIIRDVLEETDALLTANVHKGALLAFFRFAPEVKTACEQYLLYFVQFLGDLGISATAELQEQARGVLFSVTPENGPEALERIREALDLYLQMPQSPDFDAEVTRHTDIAVQQYAANVLHLRSQLVLAQAVLETKNATIEALQAANLQYKQLLSANPQSQRQLTGSGTGNAQGDETILGGTVTITKYTGKGFQVNLPLIFRTLRRTFKREG